MSSTQSLEAERESLLSRMEANREQYRRMLMDNSSTRTYDTPGQGGSASHDVRPGGSQYSRSGSQYGDSYSGADYGPSPAMQALRWVQEHPLLCAAAVAAVVAIGPRRIARTAVTGGTALTALTLRNQQNINTIVRLLSQVAGSMQSERTRYRP